MEKRFTFQVRDNGRKKKHSVDAENYENAIVLLKREFSDEVQIINHTESEIKYKVYKVFSVSHRRENIAKGCTLEEAQRLVKSYPDSKISMVVYNRQ